MRLLLIACVAWEAASSTVNVKLGWAAWPPYFIDDNGNKAGWVVEMAAKLPTLPGCSDLSITFHDTTWAKCWSNDQLGRDLANDVLDGCPCYLTTTRRLEVADFTKGMVKKLPAGGVLAKLNLSNGAPMIKPDLVGITNVIDADGWEPDWPIWTNMTNYCTGNKFPTGLGMPITKSEETRAGTLYDANDVGLETLLASDGKQVLLMTADEPDKKLKNCAKTPPTSQMCDAWNKLGTDFAFISMGNDAHILDGLGIMGKKGNTKIRGLLNTCMEKFYATKDYYDLCVKHGIEGECLRNSHFPAVLTDVKPYHLKTNELTTSCSDGYCPCPATTTTTTTSTKAVASKAAVPASFSAMAVLALLLAHLFAS